MKTEAGNCKKTTKSPLRLVNFSIDLLRENEWRCILLIRGMKDSISLQTPQT